MKAVATFSKWLDEAKIELKTKKRQRGKLSLLKSAFE